MDSEDFSSIKPSASPSEYLEKFNQMKNGFISVEEWNEFRKDILKSFSERINQLPLIVKQK
jgi:hypothetical protein